MAVDDRALSAQRSSGTRRHRGRRFIVSPEIDALGPRFIKTLLAAVCRFDRYDRQNPPHDQHASGRLSVVGVQVSWWVEHPQRQSVGGSVRRITLAPGRRRFALDLAGEP